MFAIKMDKYFNHSFCWNCVGITTTYNMNNVSTYIVQLQVSLGMAIIMIYLLQSSKKEKRIKTKLECAHNHSTIEMVKLNFV